MNEKHEEKEETVGEKEETIEGKKLGTRDSHLPDRTEAAGNESGAGR